MRVSMPPWPAACGNEGDYMNIKSKRTFLAAVVLLLILILFAFLYQRKSQTEAPEPISKTDYLLNTIVTVTLYDSQDEEILDGALDLCREYDDLLSPTTQTSEIYQLNHGELPVDEDGFYELSEKTADVISQGLSYCELSDGAFDIAIEPVSSLWDFTSGNGKVPDEAAIQAALPLVDYRDITLDGNRIRFAKEGMGINLGAIAKGYIADRIKDYLLEEGVESAIIDLGGNILCVGQRPDGTPFRIGIQKPFADRSETEAVMEISDDSVVSSGIYERYFEQDGVLYHHILDPSTGYPYDNNLVSVTIISNKSVDGDGLSTTCFALGLEKGLDLVNSLPDVQAVFITDDYQLHYSENFDKEITLSQ